MSRADRHAKESLINTMQPSRPMVIFPEPLKGDTVLAGFGVAPVPGSLKWFAYKCRTDGAVDILTPLYAGKLRGESKPAATGRLKMALLRNLGGLE